MVFFRFFWSGCVFYECNVILVVLFLIFRQHAELLLKPVVIQRSQYQKVCIEGSINSVRVSAVVSKMDDLDEILTARFLKFLTQRAEHFVVLRRKPMDVLFVCIY